jgi:nucleoid-associated protein YgaU
MSFVKELESSGFIDRLYKSRPVVAAREEPRPAPAPVAVPVKEKPAQPPVGATPRTAPAAPTSPPAQPELPREYTVVAGDTLSHLAARYYGDQFKWVKIYEANKATMKNPNFIFVGQKLIIPS